MNIKNFLIPPSSSLKITNDAIQQQLSVTKNYQNYHNFLKLYMQFRVHPFNYHIRYYFVKTIICVKNNENMDI